MTDREDDFTKAAARAWAVAAKASMEAANAIFVSWLDLPAVEAGDPGFNEEVVAVPAQPAPTDLHPGPFANRWDGNELPAGTVGLVPRRLAAGVETEVRVYVRAPAGLKSGTYSGSLLDSPGGTRLVDDIGLYVVGGRAP
jgi:hypothetical protein